MPLPDLMRAAEGFFDRAPTNGYFPWYPVLEGEWEGSWLDIRPSDHIVRGTFSKVPVVMGSVRDEGTRFTSPNTASEDDIWHALHCESLPLFGLRRAQADAALPHQGRSSSRSAPSRPF